MVESALANYMPSIQKAKEQRIAELEYLKLHVRNEPEIVEQWFDKEIEKASNLGSEMLFKRLNSLNDKEGEEGEQDNSTKVT